MIGEQIGGRYEIQARIGGGGMAIVYKAHDLLLHRTVAVKVLREQYGNDDEFIRRFRREAQSAASLSHPNVVSIYDVGQTEEIHYIVMEYIEGINLNELIRDRAPLPVEQAVHIATQICDALDHAHHNQIIHRDIKPHNILIGKNGRVKVTDFGIARAATSSTITQTGSVVGSVHYFSPEHAKGGAMDTKSDLYSLGIVLYQMLTAKLPFLGDSPISVALKHLQEDVEEPRKVNRLIPQSVENIILKSLRKNPEERYQTANEMLDDLDACLRPERRNMDKIAFPPVDLTIREQDYPETESNDDENTKVLPSIRNAQFVNEEMKEKRMQSKSSKRRKKNNLAWIQPVIWLIVFVVVIGVGWTIIHNLQGTLAVPSKPVPNVENSTIQQAETKLTTAHLRYHVTRESSSSVPKDIVIRQNPKDIKVKENATVELTVSKGPQLKKMSDYTGKALKDVKLDLENIGLSDNQITVNKIKDKSAPGTIIDQSPSPDDSFNPSKVNITLTVSSGLGTVKMPDLTGKTLSEAEAILTKNNLKLAASKDNNSVYSYTQPSGHVIDQFPYKPGDEVATGETISVVVSKGMDPDARQIIVKEQVSPAKAGTASEIKIIVSDPRYSNHVYKDEKITGPTTYQIPVIVTKITSASIKVLRDGTVRDYVTKTYKDAKNGTIPTYPQSSASDASSGDSATTTSAGGSN